MYQESSRTTLTIEGEESRADFHSKSIRKMTFTAQNNIDIHRKLTPLTQA